MSVNYGDDYKYAYTRLQDTVVKANIDGVLEPFYVANIMNKKVVGWTCKEKQTEIELKYLDMTPVQLGYCNIKHNPTPSYVTRMPHRKWRQGLRDYNMVCMKGKSKPTLLKTDIRNTIMGVYPSLETCIEYITQGECKGMAFSRDFALGKGANSKTLKILFKDSMVVGEVKLLGPNNSETILVDQFKFLKESLHEVIYA